MSQNGPGWANKDPLSEIPSTMARQDIENVNMGIKSVNDINTLSLKPYALFIRYSNRDCLKLIDIINSNNSISSKILIISVDSMKRIPPFVKGVPTFAIVKTVNGKMQASKVFTRNRAKNQLLQMCREELAPSESEQYASFDGNQSINSTATFGLGRKHPISSIAEANLVSADPRSVKREKFI